MNARIDAAAADAGRSPAAIRRLLNVDPGIEPEQLAELTLQHGFSTFVMSVSSAEDVRRFAQETAPRVRELVDAGRSGAAAAPAAAPPERDGARPLAVMPTPDDGTRVERHVAWDESTRPSGPPPDPGRRYTPDQQAAGQHLIDVHDGLRAELAPAARPGRAGRRRPPRPRRRALVHQPHDDPPERLDARRLLRLLLPRRRRPPHARGPVGLPAPARARRRPRARDRPARGGARGDRRPARARRPARCSRWSATSPTGWTGRARSWTCSRDALLSHLSYEERELVEPLARLGFY